MLACAVKHLVICHAFHFFKLVIFYAQLLILIDSVSDLADNLSYIYNNLKIITIIR